MADAGVVPTAVTGEVTRVVSIARAVPVGLVAGVIAVFVSANGMVWAFSGRDVLGPLSLGTVLLLIMPLVAGYLAGRTPPAIEGFEVPRAGWRNVAAGLLAGLLAGVVMAAFVLLISTYDVRDVLLNVRPEYVSTGPRVLTFGQDLVPGVGLILAVETLLGGAGGATNAIPQWWRRAVFTGALWVLAFALLGSLVGQVLRAIQQNLRIWTQPLADAMFEGSGALTIPAAVVLGAIGFGLHSFIARPRHQRAHKTLDGLPVQTRRMLRVAGLAVILLTVALLPQVIGSFLSDVLNFAGIYLLMALGLNIVVGFAGLLDLGFVAFFAVGAYMTALITSPQSSLGIGWIFWVAIPFVLLATALAGIMVGTPVLRMRGDYLAIVTLGFGEIARLLLLSDWLKSTFGGAQGIIRVGDIPIGPTEIGGAQSQSFFYVVFAFVLLAAYVSYALQDSRIGRGWMAMREDESVAEAMGVNIVTAKLSAFVIGAMVGGLGGMLFATKIGSVFPQSFNVIVSITVLVIIIVGGMASVPGVVLGALVLVGLPEVLREFEEYRFLLYGALLIFMMVRRPEGFIPNRRRVQELHKDEAEQDAWLEAKAKATEGT